MCVIGNVHRDFNKTCIYFEKKLDAPRIRRTYPTTILKTLKKIMQNIETALNPMKKLNNSYIATFVKSKHNVERYYCNIQSAFLETIV